MELTEIYLRPTAPTSNVQPKLHVISSPKRGKWICYNEKKKLNRRFLFLQHDIILHLRIINYSSVWNVINHKQAEYSNTWQVWFSFYLRLSSKCISEWDDAILIGKTLALQRSRKRKTIKLKLMDKRSDGNASLWGKVKKTN